MTDDNLIPNTLDADLYTFACTHCKTKKVKCDRRAPTCSSCQKARRLCDYPAFVPRPGPKPHSTKRRRRRTSQATDEAATDSRQSRDFQSHSDSEPELDSSLSALVHPVHDSPIPLNQVKHNAVQDAQALADALVALEMSQQDYWSVVNAYFANMTASSLFHKPTFHDKIVSIQSSPQIQALLLAMISVIPSHRVQLSSSSMNALSSEDMWREARRSTSDAISGCDDECPPLHLLQSLLLVTWKAAYQGMRGRAWRLVGECVRLAYEMELHIETDALNESRDWLLREERRRAWWSTWELDVFASTLKRLPTAIDWVSNSANLPMNDAAWFAGVPAKSCPLPLDPACRWKDLDKCDSISGWAWFICFNSYKWDTWLVAVTPRTLMMRDHGSETADVGDFVRKKRDVLANCLHCASLALPPRLNSKGRLLTFSQETRMEDAWCYSIALMSSVVRFMTCRLDLFPQRSGPDHSRKSSPARRRVAWDSLVENANEVASLLRNTSADHIELVNPCLSNAIWWQGCALLLRRLFGPKTVDHQTLNSNFDVMRITIRKFVKAANVPSMLVESLDTMEERMSLFKQKGSKDGQGPMPVSMTRQTGRTSQLRHEPVDAQQAMSMPTPELNSSLPSVSPMMSDVSQLQYDPLPLGNFQDGSLDFLLDGVDTWDFDADFLRCPFE